MHDSAGVNALARLDRDVLAQSGVVNLIVLEGINEHRLAAHEAETTERAVMKGAPFARELVNTQELIIGLQQIIERTDQHGIKVFGATLTPHESAEYYSEDGEATRQAVNQWIRTSGGFDGVFDFDAAVPDPTRPSEFPELYHSGDHLHPSATGYKAMANAISRC